MTDSINTPWDNRLLESTNREYFVLEMEDVYEYLDSEERRLLDFCKRKIDELRSASEKGTNDKKNTTTDFESYKKMVKRYGDDVIFDPSLKIKVNPQKSNIKVNVLMAANYEQAKELSAAVLACLVDSTAERGKVDFETALQEITEQAVNVLERRKQK